MSEFSALHWVIVAVLAAILYSLLKSVIAGFRRTGPARFCTTCGHEGQTRMQSRGSLALEIVLWLAFLLPGLIYSFWRLSTRAPVCASCGASTLVPPESPVAVKMRGELARP